jgi:hypothetical protein
MFEAGSQGSHVRQTPRMDTRQDEASRILTAAVARGCDLGGFLESRNGLHYRRRVSCHPLDGVVLTLARLVCTECVCVWSTAKRRLVQELPQQAPNENLVVVCSIVQLVVIFSKVSIRIFIPFLGAVVDGRSRRAMFYWWITLWNIKVKDRRGWVVVRGVQLWRCVEIRSELLQGSLR